MLWYAYGMTPPALTITNEQVDRLPHRSVAFVQTIDTLM
jgi:hypothetical protein